MGLKRLWMRIFHRAKKPPLVARVDQITHSIAPPDLPTAARLFRSDAVKSKTTDEGNIVVNDDHGVLSINESFPPPSTIPNDTVAPQIGEYPMPLAIPLPDCRDPYVEDAGATIVSRDRTDLDDTPSVSVLALQPVLPDQQAAAPSDRYPSPPVGTSNLWRKFFTLKNLTSRAQHHHGLTAGAHLYPNTRAVDVNASTKLGHLALPILTSNTPSQFPNQPLVPTDVQETAEDLSHETRSELSVGEYGEPVVDVPNHAPQLWNRGEDNLRTEGVRRNHKFYENKILPEIPQETSEEMVGELEPEEVILYPRKDELEVLRQRYPPPPPTEVNDAQTLPRTPPEVVFRPLVGLLRRLPPKPETITDFIPASAWNFPDEDPSSAIHAVPPEPTRRGAAPKPPHVDLDSPYSPPVASELPPLASSPLSAPPGLENSLRDSLFSSLDMYLNDDSMNNTCGHPWNTRFIGKGASGNVFRVGYKPKTWNLISGVPPIGFGKESIVASVKVIEMKRQTEGSLLGLASEVIALKVLRKKREEVADAKTKGKRMRNADGLHYLLESASLPGIDDSIFLRAGRLYLVMKHYHCDLSTYGFKVSNNEKSLAFILSESTQGLDYLHHIGMVHLDLKPSNIFITHDRHCVIGDLGSSIHRPGFIMTNEAGLFVDTVTSYTDGFCAPEIMQSRCRTDKFNCKADFWSLGVTMYDIVRPDGLSFPKMSGDDFEDHWKKRMDYDSMGLGPKHMAKMMYDVGCPGRIVNLVLNMCQRNPKKRLGGRGIIKNLKDQGLLSNPFDLSPLPDVRIPPCGVPGPKSKGSYHKFEMEEACKILKEDIERKGYNLSDL